VQPTGTSPSLVIQWFRGRLTLLAIRVPGFALLAGYLIWSSDYAFSLAGTLGYLLIEIAVACLFFGLALGKRFPALNRYYFYPKAPSDRNQPLTEKEWLIKRSEYLESVLGGWRILVVPSEDGLICVPLILVGINPVTALIAGATFASLHFVQFTYLDCIVKAVYYGLVCFFILPYGILTVVAGHLMTDVSILLLLKLTKWLARTRMR
jgi:hypothetical protein